MHKLGKSPETGDFYAVSDPVYHHYGQVGRVCGEGMCPHWYWLLFEDDTMHQYPEEDLVYVSSGSDAVHDGDQAPVDLAKLMEVLNT